MVGVVSSVVSWIQSISVSHPAIDPCMDAIHRGGITLGEKTFLSNVEACSPDWLLQLQLMNALGALLPLLRDCGNLTGLCVERFAECMAVSNATMCGRALVSKWALASCENDVENGVALSLSCAEWQNAYGGHHSFHLATRAHTFRIVAAEPWSEVFEIDIVRAAFFSSMAVLVIILHRI